MSFVLYLLRWQLSTPLLWLCIILLQNLGDFWATVAANLIGGCVFYLVDRKIFRR